MTRAVVRAASRQARRAFPATPTSSPLDQSSA